MNIVDQAWSDLGDIIRRVIGSVEPETPLDLLEAATRMSCLESIDAGSRKLLILHTARALHHTPIESLEKEIGYGPIRAFVDATSPFSGDKLPITAQLTPQFTETAGMERIGQAIDRLQPKLKDLAKRHVGEQLTALRQQQCK